MSKKPTYEELEQRVKELEKQAVEDKGIAQEVMALVTIRHKSIER